MERREPEEGEGRGVQYLNHLHVGGRGTFRETHVSEEGGGRSDDIIICCSDIIGERRCSVGTECKREAMEHHSLSTSLLHRALQNTRSQNRAPILHK